MKALSIRQPWIDAILYGHKRIENRVKWRGCNYRGDVLLHAASTMTRREYSYVVDYLLAHNIDWYKVPARADLVFGAIVARASIIDVIMPGGMCKQLPGERRPKRHAMARDPYYMGGFALVLDEKVEFINPPIPYKGNLNLFNVDDKLLEAA